jgi:hypothetical protein
MLLVQEYYLMVEFVIVVSKRLPRHQDLLKEDATSWIGILKLVEREFGMNAMIIQIMSTVYTPNQLMVKLLLLNIIH